ncbi:putative signal transduction protein containing EFhand domain protein [Nostoc sp. NIES-3756]|jgi:serine/threonine-protein phosphatase 2B regulatory subunit|uniref:EF-hand domain-containing protein n=1 Tax=Nostoc sp. NIES-3756 TaxID=1751286 RepID=UPI0007219128|nr:EF-hand domain-containing protein [Nostoc sp. NIES-3756]BAT52640.1 putative signal transduction protein containing EFhand domain protein [Nostoc sp. NIES-3756]BAY39670.1 putative signal transduction protein containing EFhand domain [Nostoc sp. NIES-2111]
MTTEQELHSLFNNLDRDQDGKVSIHELFLNPGLSAVISSETNTTSPQSLIAQYDSDEDGSITFEELRQAVKRASNLT